MTERWEAQAVRVLSLLLAMLIFGEQVTFLLGVAIVLIASGGLMLVLF